LPQEFPHTNELTAVHSEHYYSDKDIQICWQSATQSLSAISGSVLLSTEFDEVQ